MNQSAEPRRFVITAGLLTESPLAIHSGFSSEDLAALGVTHFPGGVVPPSECDQLVMRDGNGRPYIPGSSLKGVLREYLRRSGLAGALVDTLVGTGPAPGANDGELGGAGGTVVFEDAFLDEDGASLPPEHASWLANLRRGVASAQCRLHGNCYLEHSWRKSQDALTLLFNADHLPQWDATRLTYVEQMTAVDRRTGTVDEHKLFNCELVPAGIPFVVTLIVDDVDGGGLDGVRLLLRGLAGFNLDPVYRPPQLGSGTHYGWGRLACRFSTVRVSCWTPRGIVPVDAGELDVPAVLQTGLDTPPVARATRVQFNIRLRFQGPFLVNDPAQASVRRGVTRVNEKLENQPDQVPRVARISTIGDSIRALPLLPATSCKGALRSRFETILRTIHGDQVQVSPHGQLDPVTTNSHRFVKRLFGLESQQSGVWCSDFVGTEELPFQLREMVAIDRFTGSVAGSAKFNVACFDRPELTGTVVVELPHEEHEEDDGRRILGAVALLLRDLCEGDVSFGWGDMKFFGQCVARIEGLAVHAACHQAPWLRPMCQEHGFEWPDDDPRQGDAELTRRVEQVRHLVSENRISDDQVAVADRIVDKLLGALRNKIVEA